MYLGKVLDLWVQLMKNRITFTLTWVNICISTFTWVQFLGTLPTSADTLQQKMEITDLKPFLAGENTSNSNK